MSVKAQPRTQQVYRITVNDTTFVAEEQDVVQLLDDLMVALPAHVTLEAIKQFNDWVKAQEAERIRRSQEEYDARERRMNTPA